MSASDPDNYVKTVLLILAAFCGPMLLLIVYGGDIGELVGRSSKDQARFLLRLGVAVFCAILAHALVRRWFRACLVGSAAFSLAVLGVSLCGGHSLGAFSVIGLVVLFLLGFAVAAAVGLVFQLFRASQNDNQSP